MIELSVKMCFLSLCNSREQLILIIQSNYQITGLPNQKPVLAIMTLAIINGMIT